MDASTGQLVASRFGMALKRSLILIIPLCTVLAIILIQLSGTGGRWWLVTGRAHHEVTDCLTNLHDYSSIDRMFDEIILEPRNILYWSKFYGGHDFGFGLGQNPFWDHKCQISNCMATSNQSTIDEADAVVFHWADLINTGDLPKRRKKTQTYIFFHMEPPQKMDVSALEKLKEYNGFFNLTMTYMTRSSIFNPFSKYIKRNTQVPKVLERAKQMMMGKKKMVAWYALCDEDPLGKGYVEELQKYIQVDTYGPCGKLKCGPIDSSTCWDIFEKDYYFFLSIESVICRDYVTERAFRPLQFNIVPLIFAGGNFSGSMPPNSHINMLGFPNPKTLADFLRSTAKEFGAYFWYMQWKQDWHLAGWGQGFCDLCEIINHHKIKENVITDLNKFWTMEQCGKNIIEQFKSEWIGN